MQLTPLVREPGRLALSDGRIYFQPLANITGELCYLLLAHRIALGRRAISEDIVCCCQQLLSNAWGAWQSAYGNICTTEKAHNRTRPGDSPVRSHPLAAVAAVARRRASLRPQGLEAFFVAPGAGQAPGLGGVPAGPFWDAPSAFFAFR